MSVKIYINESLLTNPLLKRAKKIVFKVSAQFSNEFKLKRSLKFTASCLKNKDGKRTDYIFISGHEKYNKSDFNFLKTSNSKLYFRGGPNYKVLAVFGDDIGNIVPYFTSLKNSAFFHEELQKKYPDSTYTYDDYAVMHREFYKKTSKLSEPPIELHKIGYDYDENIYTDQLEMIIQYLSTDEIVRYFRDELKYDNAFMIIMNASREMLENGIENNRFFTAKRIEWIIKLYEKAVEYYENEE